MTKTLHPVAGSTALLTIMIFWIVTVSSEVSGNADWVMAVKTAIPWGFIVLVPALMATGISGMHLGAGRRGALLARKRWRMQVISANGLLILVPSALFLAMRAQAGQFDAAFFAVQGVELAAGAVNIALLGLNMADGLRMTGRLRRRAA
ncbi:hypothetical protein [Jannaschia rubra]|uniref:Uncharacterized protein n=1 Tax=Jannaschia rubra TaxID=282197 RepID=A0A0M6XT16_9RHOB|nr:hypothetical protein [Jannaschia rubra]CTQ33832.1 hypothetical protein JAN5088_02618 [Jannaschia rubra]SFG10261.1 hypothetical protein SAMN04488517_102668 [Jannaschia rubra]